MQMMQVEQMTEKFKDDPKKHLFISQQLNCIATVAAMEFGFAGEEDASAPYFYQVGRKIARELWR